MVLATASVRSLSLPGNLSVLAEEIRALEERLRLATTTTTTTTGVPASSLLRSQSMSVVLDGENGGPDPVLDDEDFFLIEDLEGEDSADDDDNDDDDEDRFLFRSKTPNHRHFSSSPPRATAASSFLPAAFEEEEEEEEEKEDSPPEAEGSGPRFVSHAACSAMAEVSVVPKGRSNRVPPELSFAGPASATPQHPQPDPEPAHQQHQRPPAPPTVAPPSSGTAASSPSADARRATQPAVVVVQPSPHNDVQAARACVDELVALFGIPTGAAIPSSFPREEDGSSPSSVLAWLPAAHNSAEPPTTEKARPPSMTTASSNHRHAGTMSQVRSHGSLLPLVRENGPVDEPIGDCNDGGPRFALLRASDRAQSMPARLKPSLAAKPKKSALKRTFSTASTAVSSLDGGDAGAASLLPDSTVTTSTSTASLPRSHSSASSLKRNVSFTNLEIREYDIALSDHPGCSYGPPIQLGWDYRDRKTVEVEEYERQRPPRRSPHQLVLSYNVRRYLLLKRAGYSKSELQHAMREVDRVKRGRMLTDLFLPASPIDETFEELVSRVKQLLFPPASNRRHQQQQQSPRATGLQHSGSAAL